MAKQKKKGRRKPRWQTKANAERIFAAMRSGQSLRQICLANEWPPTTVYDWLDRDYAEQYADAQAARADFFFDDILEIADNVAADKDAVAAARLKIDTRKWVMGRMNPKKYADNVKVDLRGAVTHDGNIEITPSDLAIQRIDEIISQAVGAGEDSSVADAGKK